jgi:hypothetical protein
MEHSTNYFDQEADKQETNPGGLFEKDEELRLTKMFKDERLFDYVMSLDLKPQQRVKIFELVRRHVFSNLLVYLENATNLSEAQIQEVIVLYHKVI